MFHVALLLVYLPVCSFY